MYSIPWWTPGTPSMIQQQTGKVDSRRGYDCVPNGCNG